MGKDSNEVPAHQIQNVVIYQDSDILPLILEYEDVRGKVLDLYYNCTLTDYEVRLQAIEAASRYFDITIESALETLEVAIVPFVDAYSTDGRILARKRA